MSVNLDLLEAIVALSGFILIFKQLINLSRLLRNDAQGRLYSQNNEVRALIAKHPEVRKYFYQNVEIEEDHPDYELVVTIAEMYTNWMEHLAIQKHNLKNDDWMFWSTIIRDIHGNSPIIRRLLLNKPHWYVEALREAIAGVRNRKLSDVIASSLC